MRPSLYALTIAAAATLLACSAEEPEPVTRVQALAAPTPTPAGEYTIYQTLPAQPATLPADSERARIDEVFGVPNHLWILDADARPYGSSVGTKPGQPGLTAEKAARALLARHAEHYRLSPKDIAHAQVSRVHDTGRGPVIVTLTQQHGGRDVVFGRVNVLMRRDDLSGVAITGHLHPGASLDPQDHKAFTLEPTEALELAMTDRGLKSTRWHELEADAGGFARFETDADLKTPARLKAVYFPHPVAGLLPAYLMELDLGDSAWRLILDADSGRVLLRSSLMAHEQRTYRVWADEQGTPHPNPFGRQLKPYIPGALPDFADTRLITAESFNDRGDDWVEQGEDRTVGNHVAAYADLGGRDGFDGDDVIARLSSPQTFDWVYDVTQNPGSSDEQTSAGIVQLFYTINYVHDLFYPHGFDEEAGNAQEDNYGRGGAAGDRIRAESLDSSGTNNANMFTPADGASPRMQMYRFTDSDADRISFLSPASLARDEPNIGAPEYPASFDITGEVVAALDEGQNPNNGCEAYTNEAELVGKIALIERGQCPFSEKVTRAQEAGAIGVIIDNNDVQNATRTFSMGGFQPSITIGSAMISYQRGRQLRAALANSGDDPVRARLLALPNQDASLDGDIVIHEWGHYAFGRLTQAQGSTTQLGGMNEGNSDFVAMLVGVGADDVMVEGNDQYQGRYVVGQYAGHRYATGVRRVAYSTDMSVNPLTFKHISDREPLPEPLNDRSANSEVHNTGEVWAVAMWECYAALLNEHGYDEAQERMLGYLVTSLKMFPRDATFIEARDAVLAALRASNEDDFRTCFYTFAKRGMGVGARAPGRYTGGNVGVREAFETGGALELQAITLEEKSSCDDDGYVDVGEVGQITLTVVNVGAEALDNISIRVEAFSNGNPSLARQGVAYPDGPDVTLPRLEPFGVGQVTVPIRLDASIGADLLSFRAIASHPNVNRRAEVDDGVLINADVAPNSSKVDDVEFGQNGWLIERDPQTMEGQPWTVIDADGGHRWGGVSEPFRTDIWLTSPEVEISDDEAFVFTFRHRHNFEFGRAAWDGGVLEISTSESQEWRDITTLGVEVGYGATLANAVDFGGEASDNNPLSGRPAFTGLNDSYPELDEVRIDLGTRLAGQTARVRFRLGTDEGTGGGYWELDDLGFEGITNTPFASIIDERQGCETPGEPPVAAAGEDLTVAPGDKIVLDGSASTSPEGRPLTFAWSQPDGQELVLSGADAPIALATAPEEAGELRFTLRVSDGFMESTDEIIVTVEAGGDSSGRPTAVIAPATAASGGTLVLDGSASSDPNGDALTYIWSQTEGPGLTITEGASTDTLTLSIPRQFDAASVTFELRVSDGSLLSEPATLTIPIAPETGELSGGCATSGSGDAPPTWPALMVLGLAWLRRRRGARS